MQVKSYAKINLALDVLGKKGDYHEIFTVFQQIELHDIISFTIAPSDAPSPNMLPTGDSAISVTCTNPDIPCDHNNTAHKAGSLLAQYAQTKKIPIRPMHIHIQKNIPPASGLGGASSNAAIVLITLNKLWKINLPAIKLQEMAKQIGMDVPFFLYGGTAVGEHFGEKITPLPAFNCPTVKIEINGNKPGTKEMYSKLDLSKTGSQVAKTKQMIELLKQNAPAEKIIPLIHNDFEQLYSFATTPRETTSTPRQTTTTPRETATTPRQTTTTPRETASTPQEIINNLQPKSTNPPKYLSGSGPAFYSLIN